MTFEYADKLELSELDRMYNQLAKDLKEEADAIKAASRSNG